MKVLRVLKGVAIGIVALIVLVFLAIQIALNSRVLTRIVNKVAATLVDGEVSFGKVRASVFTSFPHLSVTADDFSLIYPHDKFAAYDSLSAKSAIPSRRNLMEAGRGEVMDTLASFSSLSASINYMDLLKGRYTIRHASLSHPRIFAHMYTANEANWNILKFLGGEKTDTTSSPLPPISVRRVTLDDRSHIVFTDPVDTIFAVLGMKTLSFAGKIETPEWKRSKVKIAADSLFVAGRLPSDTLALALPSLRLDGDRECLDFSATAKAFLATGGMGRMRLPIELSGQACLPDHPDSALAVSVKDLSLSVATIALNASGDAVFYKDSTFIQAEASIDKTPVGDFVAYFGDNFPFLKKIHTNALLSLDAMCEGYLNPSRNTLPEIVAQIVVPQAKLAHDDIPRKGIVGLNILAETDPHGKLDVSVKEATIDAGGGLLLKAKGGAADILGKDPLLNADGIFQGDVKTLTDAFTSSMGISGTGSVTASINGKARLSQLSLEKIARADISADIDVRDLRIHDLPDTISAAVDHARIKIAARGNKIDPSMKKGARVLGLSADIDTLNVVYADNTFIRAGGLSLLAQDSAEILKAGTSYTPFMGILKGDRVSLRDASDLGILIAGTQETFRITPAMDDSPVTLKLTSKNERVGIKSGVDRYGLKGLDFNASASMRSSGASAQMRSRRKHFLDSLQRVYPDIPRDSLLRHSMRNRTLPSWLQDEQFRKSDIHIDLGESIKKYFREWDFSGNLKLESGRVMTPYFPLKTRISNVSGNFNNDSVSLGNVTINSGESDISAKATLSGLRRVILGRGIIDLDAEINSEYIDANELLRAYAAGTTYTPDKSSEHMNDMASDSAYEKMIGEKAASDTTVSQLIVIPANLVAKISLNANRIKYDSLMVTWAAADLAMKQRCLQITNTVATSNMGDIYFEGFYSTRTRKDIKAGFDLNMVDITAEKVITLFPAVDTLMPILRSFEGMLDCELAATTDLDTEMNLVLPSIDGVMKISGKDLTLQDSEEFTQIAKILMFKNKKKGTVDKMNVTGMIRNNSIEIFPFVLKIDRYTLAASGIQHLDESYKYHISVIRSPLILKFGINVFGNDFDHMKFRVGKAKYKNTNVPVFTKQLDTVQYSLINSIHNIFEKGVEKAIRENQDQSLIQDRMQKIGYNVESEVDTLTAVQLDSLRTMQDSLSKPVEERIGVKLDSLQAQVKDAGDVLDDADEMTVSGKLKTIVQGRKAEKAVEKAIRKEERAARRAEKAARREEKASAKQQGKDS